MTETQPSGWVFQQGGSYVEELIAKLNAYSRFLELEDSLPYWEGQRPERKTRIEELNWNRQQKELALAALENPNFFQKLLGRTEEKKERLSSQLREVMAAWTAAKWELEGLEKQITAGRQELETLRGSREAYEKAKMEAVPDPALESRLMMEEITAFAPAAMTTAGRVLEALEDARFWMQQDAVRKGVSHDNRKMEHLSAAEDGARRLAGILSVLPEGVAAVGSYLQDPHSYIYGVSSEFGQLDRLNRAQEQIRTVRNQLRILLGE